MSARQAISNTNIVLAEHAIEEARGIRPDAAELTQLEAELRMFRPRDERRLLLRRAASAVIWLAAGVSMFIALDATRIARHALPLIVPPPPPSLLTSVAPPHSVDVPLAPSPPATISTVSYTHLRAHETHENRGWGGRRD